MRLVYLPTFTHILPLKTTKCILDKYAIHGWYGIDQVIQSPDLLIPLVGGHQQPLEKGHVFTISKRSRIESPGKQCFAILCQKFENAHVQLLKTGRFP